MPKVKVSRPFKTVSIGFRTTPEVNEMIVASAEANGRSVASEIEFRLKAAYRGWAPPQAIDRSVEDRTVQ